MPNLAATPTKTVTSEWVGIDGIGGTTALIQAGVQETYQPSTNLVYTSAWWEILPAPNTLITSMRVTPGDSVTATIGQVSGTLWGITVTDNTTGQSFATAQTYSGPQASAEWIVEAPKSLTGTQETLGEYSPAVTFSDLRFNGPETTLTPWIMVQGGVTVSVPSALTTAGFSVAYVATPAPTPTPTSTPTPAPSLQVYTITLGQPFNLTLTGGTPYLQAQWQLSSDQVTWTVLTTVTLDASGNSTYTFAPSATAYYRTYLPSTGQYGPWLIEVIVVQPVQTAPPPPTSTPTPGTSPAPPGVSVPPYSTAVPPAGLTQLSSTDWWAGPALATSLGGAIVHVAASDSSGPVNYYRSLDGGLTFAPPVTLTAPGTSGYTPALASAGSGLVIAAWTAPTGPGTHGVMVVRSSDYGSTWSSPVLLSSGDVQTWNLAVASDGGHRVVVSWVDAFERVSLRLSQDGGVTFGATVRLGTALKGSGASLAFSSGTLLAVWQAPTRAIVVRRNSAAGSGSWTAPVSLATRSADGGAFLAARGSAAVVAYTVTMSGKARAVVRVSTDRGLHWSTPRLAPATSQGEGVTGVVLPGSGRLQLVTTRGDQVDLVAATAYGLSWNTAVRLSDPRHDSIPDAVALGSRTLVLFWTVDSTGLVTTLDIARF